MKLLRPQSLSSLVLLALAIIALPLITALVTAGVQLRQLVASSERIITEGVTATRRSQEQAAAVSSQARLYLLLDPETLNTYQDQLKSYMDQDARLDDIGRYLSAYLRDAEARAALAEFDTLRAGMSERVRAGTAVQSEIDAGFERLRRIASLVSTRINEQIDTATADLRASTERAQTLLFWGFVPLIPLTVIAVVLFSFKVVRPLRQIDRAISELGSGALHRSIQVAGPRDIEKLGRQLEWLRLRLLELAQERNRFLRHMSHELKTPLANIREGTELLMDGAVGELQGGQREVTGILRENGIRLQRMIENLLSFSAWQTSSVGLEITEFRLRPLVKQIIENQQLALLSQRVRLDVNVEDLTVAADRSKLRLILENLLSNAIKYTPRSGTIHIRARAEGGELVLEVADSGPGIPPEERKQVFEAFYTGKAPAGHIKGTGIGLSVVMEFVNAHGGAIEIVDGQWPGAHFRIRMPQRAVENTTGAAAHAA
ncbi:MAG: HAMP domain-containing histidine kinase [Pseudomonadota bacterium]|nr:HAMP domain-containing histidine kinase [Pseudomonadota bacterium]